MVRRAFLRVSEWRVGINFGTYSHLHADSGLGPLRYTENSPYVKLEIPGGTNSIYQQILPSDVHGFLTVRDRKGLYTLLYQTDVTGGTAYAVGSLTNVRNTIGYFAVVTDVNSVNDTTDVRTPVTTTYVFTGTRIGQLERVEDEPACPVVVEFFAEHCTVVDT